MSGFDPDTIATMRRALEDVMAGVPPDAATPAVKAAVAECLCKAAMHGESTYDGFIATAGEHIQQFIAWLL